LASAELSRRVQKVVGYLPLSELDDVQRREFHDALLEAAHSRISPGSGRRRS
jgi:acetyl/propionyl-CoA carboxylase alpha subunit